MDLNQVQGLGPAKIKNLEAAGITTVQKLAALDLRRNVDVPGVSRDALRQHKADARKLLAAEGKNVPKAPYRSAKTTSRKPRRTRPAAPSAQEDQVVVALEETPRPPTHVERSRRRGIWARLLRRA